MAYMNLKNLAHKPFFLVTVAGLSVWLILFFLNIGHFITGEQIFGSAVFTEIFIHSATVLLVLKLYQIFSSEDKKIFFWLIVYIITLYLTDIGWWIVIDIFRIADASFWDLTFVISYSVCLPAILIFIAKILTLHTIPIKRFFLFFFCLAFVNIMLMLMFMSYIHWNIKVFSLIGAYELYTALAELIIFDLIIFCLIFCREKGLMLFFTGTMIIMLDDCWIRYSYITKTFMMFSYIELFWMLGLSLNLLGLFIIQKEQSFSIKNWLGSAYSIKSRLIISTFGVSITSLIGFASLIYFFTSISRDIFTGLLFFIMLYSIIIAVLSFFIGKQFEALFKKLEKNISNYSSMSTSEFIDHNFSIDEFIFLNNFVKDSINIYIKKEQAEKMLVDTASQVAHDIRSPLLVLKNVLNDLSSLPERKRIDYRNAIQRVTDIANNLLIQYRNDVQQSIHTSIERFSEPVAIMLESIISEKRIQVVNSHIEINLQFPYEMYNAFVYVDIVGFKRVLSNLMNNAIESFKGAAGVIIIQLSRKNEKIVIDVKDHGCGLSEEKIALILKQGGSFDKKEGSGLGLPYAMNKIKEWQGEYSFTSKLDKGTQFEIILPEAKSADWFKGQVNLSKNSTVVILDDDEYIHRIWNERLPENLLLENRLTLLHFTFSRDLIIFCKNNTIENTVFFVDYELGHDQMTGLDVVKKLDIGVHTTLVTSRYEDQNIRKNCQELGMKIIPKFFVEIIPINVVNLTEIVFIDNEKMITNYWKETAEGWGKKISVFNDPDDFMKVAHLYSKDVAIYIDSSLEKSMKGEDFAEILYKNGFHTLILATGHPRTHFKHVTWVKDIVGKEPPWGDPPQRQSYRS